MFSDTIFNNVSFGNDKLRKEDVIKYLKLAKADYALELPEGIDTIIGENGVSLSGGEKQMEYIRTYMIFKQKVWRNIKDKKVSEYGTHKELMQNKGDYYNLYMSQAKMLC